MNHTSRASIVLVILLTACSVARGPVIGKGDKPPNTGGTISGIVRAASDNTPMAGRKVTAVNLESGERIEGTTATNGGYTIKVPIGHYRLEIALQIGEAVTNAPDEVHITTSDLDAGRNFAIGIKR